MGETIVMGLSGVGIDYSRGPICTDQVREIVKLAQLHSLELGSYKLQPSI